MIKLLFKIKLLCILLFCFPVYGENENVQSEVLSKYEHLPVYIETANLRWKSGFSAYYYSDKSVLQLPLFLELQVPFSVESSKFKWLVQAGGGWMQYYQKDCDPFFIPTPPEPPFDSDFFRESYEERRKRATDKSTCRTEWAPNYEKSFPYFIFQPGLMYDFGVLTGFIRAGVFLGFWNAPELLGAVASVSIGTMDWWDIGIQALYYDRWYFGLSLAIGSSLKKWQVKNPYKDDPYN